MRVLQEHGGLQLFRLAAIKRQAGKSYRRAVELLARGDTLEGFDTLNRPG